MLTGLNALLKERFGADKLALTTENYHIGFDLKTISAQKLDYDAIKKAAVQYLQKLPGVQFAVDVDNLGNSPIPEPIRTMIANGYNPKRCGPVAIIPEPGWYSGSDKGTTHGNWNPYDTHLPLVFMGWHVKHGTSNDVVSMADIAPTIAAMLRIQMPNGAVGKPVQAVYK
jgi:hypothetical protein